MRSYLFVDDNVAFAENLAEIARDLGDDVAVAGSGAAALELVARQKFDALVSDMRMPSMGGAELVHRVRRVDPGLPAIVVTAYTQDDDLAAARHDGLLAILPKPVPIPRLLELLGLARRDGLVALVEDDISMSDNLCELLRSRGFAAVTAASVLETKRLGEVAPFCGLVDLRVPGGPDGEAMRSLAARFPKLRMMVVTAHGGERLPFEDTPLFIKPFDSEALLATVERLHASQHG